MPGPVAQRRKLGPAPPPAGGPPANFGAPAEMGNPLSVPEDPSIGYAAGPEAYEPEPLWLKLPDHLAPYFSLGFTHTNETCPYVVLRARDDAQLDNVVEVGGPPEAFLELAQVIAALCRSVPCIAHREYDEPAHSEAG